MDIVFYVLRVWYYIEEDDVCYIFVNSIWYMFLVVFVFIENLFWIIGMVFSGVWGDGDNKFF